MSIDLTFLERGRAPVSCSPAYKIFSLLDDKILHDVSQMHKFETALRQQCVMVWFFGIYLSVPRVPWGESLRSGLEIQICGSNDTFLICISWFDNCSLIVSCFRLQKSKTLVFHILFHCKFTFIFMVFPGT